MSPSPVSVAGGAAGIGAGPATCCGAGTRRPVTEISGRNTCAAAALTWAAVTAPIPAPQPVVQPVVYDSMTTQGPGAASIGSSGSYTVRKGDTLYAIAKNKYGDGKQWTRIASANPGLRPETLKAGQAIVVP